MTMGTILSKPKTNCWSSLIDRMRTLREDAAGVAAIEFAIMIPCLIVMTVGTVDLGMGIYRNMQVQNAAQIGAQYAMTNSFDPAQIASIVSGATGMQGISASPAPVQFCGCATSSGVSSVTCGSTCPGGAIYGNYVRVSSQGTYTTLLPYPMFASSFTLTSQSTVRVQ
ncbi:TadE/TadG family type IV pilus assembly protein [Bradyrhizobium sp.]|uniref:TadE/TadG family type IV pilus assembly protein n=1 Tax=Bradyrhizobium sp. TaxID=376 RepID=UPI003C75DD70